VARARQKRKTRKDKLAAERRERKRQRDIKKVEDERRAREEYQKKLAFANKIAAHVKLAAIPKGYKAPKDPPPESAPTDTGDTSPEKSEPSGGGYHGPFVKGNGTVVGSGISVVKGDIKKTSLLVRFKDVLVGLFS
jgi:hypothetical protein